MNTTRNAEQSATQAIVHDMAKDTKVSTPVLQDVYLTVNAEAVVEPDAKAYYYELKRLNPDTFHAAQIEEIDAETGEPIYRALTVEDLQHYFKGIIKIRVESTTDEGCRNWRLAKKLAIPAKLEMTISALGIVYIRESGLKLIPEFDFNYDMNLMLQVSQIIESFGHDGLYFFKDAFPRSSEGNVELMSFICKDGTVFGTTNVLPPEMAYVAGYLGLQITEEGSKPYSFRYLVPYERVEYIKQAYYLESRLVCSPR